jgi:hypothetical protein
MQDCKPDASTIAAKGLKRPHVRVGAIAFPTAKVTEVPLALIRLSRHGKRALVWDRQNLNTMNCLASIVVPTLVESALARG